MKYNQAPPDPFYLSAKWKKKREYILRRDHYIDQVAKRYGKMLQATIVHHIYPLADYPQFALCDWNLISVSVQTHRKLENNGTLSELGKRLQLTAKIPKGVLIL